MVSAILLAAGLIFLILALLGFASVLTVASTTFLVIAIICLVVGAVLRNGPRTL